MLEIVPFNLSYAIDLKLISEVDWDDPPKHWQIRVGKVKFPVGYYAYRFAGVHTIEIEDIRVRDDFRRLKFGTLLLEHLLRSCDSTLLKMTIPETAPLSICNFLKHHGFYAAYRNGFYFFERKVIR